MTTSGEQGDESHLTLRISSTLSAAIDQRVEELRAERGDAGLTRSNVVRELITIGLRVQKKGDEHAVR